MSRFVTAGGDEAKPSSSDPAREDAWAKAQAQIEAARAKPKTQDGKQEGGKSLYDVLQANKERKEQAFEEANRLKNQFRALDDDELDYLESVEETARRKEAAAEKETAEELEAFRKQQQEAERRTVANVSSADDDAQGSSIDVSKTTWQTKKRRRKEPAIVVSAKVRKMTATADQSPEPSEDCAPDKPEHDHAAESKNDGRSPSLPTPAPSNALGLGVYDDSDDD